MTDSSDDTRGYGRPPRDSQFKKGTSGNPKGRRKRKNSFKADLTSELQETLILTENGKPRRVTKQRAFIKTLTAAAIKKDIRAVNALLACVRHFGLETEEQIAPTADPDDLEIPHKSPRPTSEDIHQFHLPACLYAGPRSDTKVHDCGLQRRGSC
jgi:hypothetical protein